MSGRNSVATLTAPEITRPSNYMKQKVACKLSLQTVKVRNWKRNGRKREKNHISRNVTVRRNAPAGNQSEQTQYGNVPRILEHFH